MKYEKLGASGLKISRICLGSNNFGSQVSQQDALKILQTAFDLGVNTVDTANIYTQGKSEQIIGEWARGRRDDVIIATKVGMEQSENPNRRGLSRTNIVSQLEKSLDRLKTDYIDLYYVHQFDDETPLSETLKTFDFLVRENKVRYIACSNFSAEQLSDSISIQLSLDLENFIANQVRYNVLQREIESTLPFCLKQSIGIIAYSPLRSGLLAGRYEKNCPPPEGSRGKARGAEYLKNIATDENFARLDKLKKIAKEAEISLPALSISWILAHRGITSAVVGASNPDQFKETVASSDLILSDEIVRQVNEV
ncbi:MAG: aldo/keto reductase [Nitrososphaerales archaeon]